MNHVENPGGGPMLVQQMNDMMQPILEQWTGQKLRPVSLYGIRIYKRGSILASHVDRMPLISSAIREYNQSRASAVCLVLHADSFWCLFSQ